MNTFQFVASIVGSLAWPAAIVIMILILRRPLTRTITSLQKLTYKELRLDFGQEISKLEVVADQANVPNVALESNARPKRRDSSSSQVEDEDVYKLLTFFGETAPTDVIVRIWSQAEREIQAAVDRLGLSSSYSSRNSLSQNIQLLMENGFIDYKVKDILDGLSALQKEIAHGNVKEEEITYTQLIGYMRLTQRMINFIKSL